MFKDFDGSFRRPGDTIEADGTRAAKLHQYGFIGGKVETEKIEPQEKAIKEKPKNKKRGRPLISEIKETGKIEPAGLKIEASDELKIDEENSQEKE